MPTYKLTYFNLRGRAEVSRLLFAVAGVPYEDFRFERDQWPAIKPSTPFGQIPFLEIDGVKYCQSNAIGRYLANKFGLAGKNDLEQLRADMIVDCCEDMVQDAIHFMKEQEATKKAELQKKYQEETLPPLLKNLEAILVENNNGDGYFVGNELTWADLSWICYSNWLAGQAGATFDGHPKLKAHIHRVEGLPKIAEWIAKRPVTAM